MLFGNAYEATRCHNLVKVQLALFTLRGHVGGVEVQFLSFLTSALVEVIC